MFSITEQPGYRLYRDGEPIIDTNGRPVVYATREEAQHVADNWDRFRAPTFAELRAMPDEELLARAQQAAA